MRRKLFLFVALFSLLAFNLTPVSADGGIEIGQKIENFTLTGIDGKGHERGRSRLGLGSVPGGQGLQ